MSGIRWISVPKDPRLGNFAQSLCEDCFIERTSPQNNHGIKNFFLVKLFPEITDYGQVLELNEKFKIQYDVEDKYSEFTLYKASRFYTEEDYLK